MQLPELFLGVIPLVPDESDNLGNASFRESDGSIISLLVQVPDNFPLEKRGEYLKIFYAEG